MRCYLVQCDCSCGATAQVVVSEHERDAFAEEWLDFHVGQGHTAATLATPVQRGPIVLPWADRQLLALEDELVRRGRAGLVL